MQRFFSGFQPRLVAAGRAVILALLVVCLSASALGEDLPKGRYNEKVPPPIPPAHDPAEDDYFSDALFIGDSIMDDVEMYDFFPTANFVTLIGMSPLSVDRRQFRAKGTAEKANLYDAMDSYDHAKIYILLGSNSLDNKGADRAIADYVVMLDQMVRRFPDSMFYLIAPPPMTQKYMQEKGMSPYRAQKFRDLLEAAAAERNLYFLDYYSVLVDDEGFMPKRFDCSDGVHPNRRGLTLLNELVRTHTVEMQEND